SIPAVARGGWPGVGITWRGRPGGTDYEGATAWQQWFAPERQSAQVSWRNLRRLAPPEPTDPRPKPNRRTRRTGGFLAFSFLPAAAARGYTSCSPVGHPAGCRCSGPSNAIASRQRLGLPR